MNFIKTHFRDALKLYVNQIGITIFALMLYTASGVAEGMTLLAKLRTIVSVFSILFYLVLIYFVAWEFGAKDKIRIDAGRMTAIKGKGLYLGLMANVPNLLLSVPTVIFGYFFVGGNETFANLFGFFQMFTMAHASMYMGLIQTIVYGLKTVDTAVIDQKYLFMSLLYVLLPLVSALVAHFAYSLGSCDKKLLSLFSSKNK